MSQPASNAFRRLARFGARAFFAAAALSALAGCDLRIGDGVGSLPADATWQALPVRAFLTRPTIHLDAAEFCRKARCGYDGLVAQVTASGAEAQALHASLAHPAALAALIGTPRPNIRHKPANVSVEDYATGDWKGVRIAISGPSRDHDAYGIVLEHPQGAGSRFVIVGAAYPDVARRLAADAIR